MPDPDYVAAEQAVQTLTGILTPMADPQGVLKDFEVEREFFLLVMERAQRLHGDLTQARRRNRLMLAADEVPPLLRQASRDLKDMAVPEEEKPARDAYVGRVDGLRDAVAGFTSRIRP